MFNLKQWARWLTNANEVEDINFSGVSIDSRTTQPGDIFVAIVGEKFNGHAFIAQAKAKGAVAALVVEPTGELPYLLVKDTRLALGKIAAGWLQELAIPVVAVTGSNGKTTVKEMIAAILREQFTIYWSQGNFNNDYGLPMSLLKLTPAHQYAVLEMGANHAGEIAYLTQIAPPDVALINNVFPAHTEGFGSLDGVARSKAEIYQGLKQQGIALVNIDDKYADYWRTLIGERPLYTFGLSPLADIKGTLISPGEFELHTPQGSICIQLQLLGEHNIRNAIAASAAAYACQVSVATIKAGLEKMQPVSGRLVPRAGLHGNLVIDDTYNANPGSVTAAIRVLADFAGKRILVLGEMRELGEDAVKYHAEIGQLACQFNVDYLLGYGELAQHAVSAMGEKGYHFTTQAQLTAKLKDLLSPDTVVLVKGSRSMQMENIVAELIQK